MWVAMLCVYFASDPPLIMLKKKKMFTSAGHLVLLSLRTSFSLKRYISMVTENMLKTIININIKRNIYIYRLFVLDVCFVI